jgi:hypothetical protein
MKIALILLTALLFVGCNKSAIDPNEGMSEEQVEVNEFIREFADSASNAGFKDNFTKPPSAAEMKKYRSLYFSATDVQVSGNSATVVVEISKPGEQDPMATKTWKLTKTGETWKMDSAPVD